MTLEKREEKRKRKLAKRAGEKYVLSILKTRSVLRFQCTPAQLKAAAKKIAMNVMAHQRRTATV